jgi:hypothetical protein
MKKILAWLAVAWLLLLAFPVLAQEFYVISGPSPKGMKITSLPVTINAPGLYYLTSDLYFSKNAADAIVIASDDVTLDLMGFQIKGPGSGSRSYAIKIYDGTIAHKNVEVRNGCLTGWGSALTDCGRGMGYRALNLRVDDCWNGIVLTAPDSGDLVKNCTVDALFNCIEVYKGVITGNSIYGISGATGIEGSGTISNNSLSGDLFVGIWCEGESSVIGNTVVSPSEGNVLFYINTNGPVLVTQNTASGPGTHFQSGDKTVNINNAGF